MVVALIALFVSATGFTWAANKLPAGSVKSKQIVDGAVKHKDLALDSVTGDNVLDGSLGPGELGLDSVTGDQLADGSVDSLAIQSDAVGVDQIGFDAVGTDEIAADAVGSEEIMDGSVGAAEVSGRIVTEMGEPVNVEGATGENASYRISTATATCAEGEQVIGGFAQWDPDDADDNEYELVTVQAVVDAGSQTVTVEGGNDSGVDHSLYAVAICLT
jgi:hypothetical protein